MPEPTRQRKVNRAFTLFCFFALNFHLWSAPDFTAISGNFKSIGYDDAGSVSLNPAYLAIEEAQENEETGQYHIMAEGSGAYRDEMNVNSKIAFSVNQLIGKRYSAGFAAQSVDYENGSLLKQFRDKLREETFDSAVTYTYEPKVQAPMEFHFGQAYVLNKNHVFGLGLAFGIYNEVNKKNTSTYTKTETKKEKTMKAILSYLYKEKDFDMGVRLLPASYVLSDASEQYEGSGSQSSSASNKFWGPPSVALGAAQRFFDRVKFMIEAEISPGLSGQRFQSNATSATTSFHYNLSVEYKLGVALRVGMIVNILPWLRAHAYGGAQQVKLEAGGYSDDGNEVFFSYAYKTEDIFAGLGVSFFANRRYTFFIGGEYRQAQDFPLANIYLTPAKTNVQLAKSTEIQIGIVKIGGRFFF